MDAKLCLKMFRHEGSIDEPKADKDYLLKALAEALGFKVYYGFKDDVLRCIKENYSEDEIINCIAQKLKRSFEPKEPPTSSPVIAPESPPKRPNNRR
ncbi:hypothetical protein ACV4QK_20315 (plasmid) [Alteromonas macleodii]|jgi:hypothetical protein|nr:hypothetical protein [Alteromonadaceae bacterium A_SAG1]